MPLAAEARDIGHNQWAPLALGFRPFFLHGIWFAVLLMAISLYGFHARWQAGYFNAPLWHAHEMLFGYATAVIAGFLLTAVRNWTRLPTPTGAALALLVMLWLAPRILSLIPAMPPVLFTLSDVLFLPILAIILGRLIFKAKQPHNYPIPVILLLMSLCNGAVHLESLGLVTGVSSQAMQIAVCLLIALITTIGGRVVPFFMQAAIGTRPVPNKFIETLALPSVLLLALSIATPFHGLILAAALFAGVAHSVRLIGWFDRAILQLPMLWVLHTGYAWMVAGFLLYGLAEWMNFATAQAVHAWTVGAIGMFTLGMMTRVALGHTGRAMQALPWIPTAFMLVFVAALCRVILPIVNPALLDSAVTISATCWIIAFFVAGIRYSLILLQARADGKPG